MSTISSYWERDSALVSNILGTDFDSKAAASVNAITTIIDNTAGFWFYAMFYPQLGSVNPAAGGSIFMEFFASLDGTNYPDLTANSGFDSLTFLVSSGSSAKNLCPKFIRLPPFKIKMQLTNNMSVSTAASANSLTYWKFRELGSF